MGQEYHDLYFLYALITSDYVEYSTHCSQSKYLNKVKDSNQVHEKKS